MYQLSVLQPDEIRKLTVPPLAKSYRKLSPNIQAFKHVLDLTSKQKETDGAKKFNSFKQLPDLNILFLLNDPL